MEYTEMLSDGLHCDPTTVKSSSPKQHVTQCAVAAMVGFMTEL